MPGEANADCRAVETCNVGTDEPDIAPDLDTPVTPNDVVVANRPPTLRPVPSVNVFRAWVKNSAALIRRRGMNHDMRDWALCEHPHGRSQRGRGHSLKQQNPPSRG